MSTIRCDNFGPSAGGTTYSARGIAKAWASLTGTGTASVDNELNVSSVTDNGTGNYSGNFTNSLATAFYGSTCSSSLTGQVTRIGIRTTSAFTSQSVDPSGTAQDASAVVHSIMGDLA